eukprot:PhF_6_TR1547/c0_g1_i3/m.2819
MLASQQLILTIVGATSAFGATATRDRNLCRVLGQKLALLSKEQHVDVVVQTGGTGGFPLWTGIAYLDALEELHQQPLVGDAKKLLHYVPRDYVFERELVDTRSRVFWAGEDMEERRTILAALPAHAVVVIQGGPGTF